MQFSKEPYISAAKISISPQTTKDLRGKSVTRGRRIQNTKYSLFSAQEHKGQRNIRDWYLFAKNSQTPELS